MAQEFDAVDHFFSAQGGPEFNQATHSFANAQALLLNGRDTWVAAILPQEV
jgi:hypothetical protein